MSENPVPFDAAAAIHTLAALSLLVVVGLYHSSLARVITSLFTAPHRLMQDAVNLLARERAALLAHAGRLRSGAGIEQPDRFVSYMIGAWIYFGMMLVFGYCEYHLLALSYGQVLGLGEKTPPLLRISPVAVSSLGLIFSGAFWASILFDLAGKTHFVPWHLMRWGRGLVITLAFCCLSLLIALGGALGGLRAAILLDDGTGVTLRAIYEFVVWFTSTVFTPLMLVSGAAAFCCMDTLPLYGRLALAGLIRLLLGAVALACEVLARAIAMLHEVAMSVFCFVARIGVQLARPMAGLLGRDYFDTHIRPGASEAEPDLEPPAAGEPDAHTARSEQPDASPRRNGRQPQDRR